jgi:hypothetical protein
VTLDQRLALEGGQRLSAFVRTFAPHANNVTATGVAEALDRRRVRSEVCFKPFSVRG